MPGPGAIRAMDPWPPPLPPRPAPPPRTASPAWSDGPRSARACWAWPSASGAVRSSRAPPVPSGSSSPSSGPRGCSSRSRPAPSSPPHDRPIPAWSGPASRSAVWWVPGRWSSRRSATTATPRPPPPCSGRPPGWASLARAFAALSPSRQLECAHLRGALVRRHPETGEALLFLSPLYLHRIIGVERRRGERMLLELERLLDDPLVQVRWRWRAGDVAIWDEAATCHRALGDHFPQRRAIRRCVVEGSAPEPV